MRSISTCTGAGKRRRQSVHVQLRRVVSFRLEKELMAFRRRELDDLVLDGRAVARPPRADRPAVHGRLPMLSWMICFPGLAEKGDPAWQLAGMPRRIAPPPRRRARSATRNSRTVRSRSPGARAASKSTERPSIRGGVPVLNRATVETHLLQLLGEMRRRRFASAPAGELGRRCRCGSGRAERCRW